MLRMKTRQSGVSVPGVLIIVALWSFFITLVFRLMPTYVNSRSVKTALAAVVAVLMFNDFSYTIQ